MSLWGMSRLDSNRKLALPAGGPFHQWRPMAGVVEALPASSMEQQFRGQGWLQSARMLCLTSCKIQWVSDRQVEGVKSELARWQSATQVGVTSCELVVSQQTK
jgi:hypothetical protein